MELNEIIEGLIESGREGEYWDFKEEHHENTASLTHDILCLANSVTKCDKYIIYGVSDPSRGCELKGVETEGRRTQAQIIDILRGKKFASEIRPEVELVCVNIRGMEVDVLKIFDRPEKPYYLSDTFSSKGKHANKFHIYSRSLDTNTPVTENADPRKIELMWRERFGLDAKPADRMRLLLREPENWEKDIGNKDTAYHKHQPEYNIVIGAPSPHEDSYSYFYSNHKSFYGELIFKYLSVELFHLHYIYCDEMRLIISAPEDGVFITDDRTYYYHYYIRGSRSWDILKFLTNGSLSFESGCHRAPFIVFNSDSDKVEFDKYIENDKSKLERSLLPEASSFRINQIGIDQKKWNVDPFDMVKVWNAYQHWENKKA